LKGKRFNNFQGSLFFPFSTNILVSTIPHPQAFPTPSFLIKFTCHKLNSLKNVNSIEYLNRDPKYNSIKTINSKKNN